MSNTAPLGYKRVEYLESTGTQYIDTNYIPVQGDNLEFKNVSINQENSGALFSAGTGNYQLILIMNLEHYSYFKYFSTGIVTSFYNNTLNNATIKIQNEKIYINDILKTTSNYEGEVNTSLNIFRRADNTSYINAKMGEIIITNNNTLVRDYIPVLNENNEAGLYDLVNKEFYGNSGTGSFQYGNIIPEGTIAEKFNYSLEAKELIKDGINYLGGNVTDETTLKEYRDELDSVYNKLPKVSNSTASDNVTLYPTLKGRIDSTLKGQIGQEGNPSPENEIPVKCVTGENTVRVRGKNIFNVSKVTEELINTSTGATSSNSGWRLSDYVPVKSNTNYNLSWTSDNGYFQVRMAYYNSSKEFVSGEDFAQGGTYSKYFTTPNNIAYCRINYSVVVSGAPVTRENIQIEQGSTATTYEPYYTPQEKELDLGELELYENGYFSRENGKWYLNNEYDKFIINSTFTQGNPANRFILQDNNLNKYSSSSIGLCTIGSVVGSVTEQPTENGLVNFYIQPSINLLNAYVKYNSMTLTEFNTKIQELISAGKTLYLVAKLQTPSKVEIPNQTLINQLNDIYKLMSYQGTTIIETECEVGNMPIIISASALLDSAKIIEDLETRIEVLESEE